MTASSQLGSVSDEYDAMSEYFEGFEAFDYEALGIDPTRPTDAKPGSEEKVNMLAARYAAGLPLWHSEDCYDHSPGQLLPAFGDFAQDDEDDEDV